MASKRSHSGSIFRDPRDNRYYARRQYRDRNGRMRERKRVAKSAADARLLLKAIEEEIKREIDPTHNTERLTFQDLADFFTANYLKPARYSGDTKTEGYRCYNPYLSFFNVLVAHFGKMRLKSISYDDVRQFKLLRARTETVNKRPRAAASVNRELQLLRRMLNIALRKKWIPENPMAQGDPLISTSEENSRLRVLTPDEERRLLAECTGRREHLRAAIICAIDTGLRANEQFTLAWKNVNLDARLITVSAFNAKTRRERSVPVTDRLFNELAPMSAGKSPDDLVFTVKRHKTAFNNACRDARVENFNWHDLRHCAATWMIEAGVEAAEAMRVLGHTSFKTFMRYVNLASPRLKTIGSMLDARRRLLDENRAIERDISDRISAETENELKQAS